MNFLPYWLLNTNAQYSCNTALFVYKIVLRLNSFII